MKEIKQQAVLTARIDNKSIYISKALLKFKRVFLHVNFGIIVIFKFKKSTTGALFPVISNFMLMHFTIKPM